jgi:hypothetical protein
MNFTKKLSTLCLLDKVLLKIFHNIFPEMFGFRDTCHHPVVHGVSCSNRGHLVIIQVFEKAFHHLKADGSALHDILSDRL